MIWRISWFSVLILCSSICRKIGAFNVEEKIEGFYGITKDYLLPSWVASAFLHFSVCNVYRCNIFSLFDCHQSSGLNLKSTIFRWLDVERFRWSCRFCRNVWELCSTSATFTPIDWRDLSEELRPDLSRSWTKKKKEKKKTSFQMKTKFFLFCQTRYPIATLKLAFLHLMKFEGLKIVFLSKKNALGKQILYFSPLNHLSQKHF